MAVQDSNLNLNYYLNINVTEYKSIEEKFLKEIEYIESITGIKKIPIHTVKFLLAYLQFIKINQQVNKAERMLYFPVTLQNRKIILETPVLLCLFGLYKYKVEYSENPKFLCSILNR